MAIRVEAKSDLTQQGIVVRAGQGKLIMTDAVGRNEQTHVVAADARVTCDARPCKVDELQKGYTVKVVTERRGDIQVATRIDTRTERK